jgi:hypothetical protein
MVSTGMMASAGCTPANRIPPEARALVKVVLRAEGVRKGGKRMMGRGSVGKAKI